METLRHKGEHKLNIKPGSKPVKQRCRHISDEQCKAIDEEIKKLLRGSSEKYSTPSGLLTLYL
jgi:hypothetical protein